MDSLAIFQNRKFRRLMTEELRRKQLGPFAAPESAPREA